MSSYSPGESSPPRSPPTPNAETSPPKESKPPEPPLETELKRIRILLTGILIVLLLKAVFPLGGAVAGDATKIDNGRYSPLYVEVVNGKANRIPVVVD